MNNDILPLIKTLIDDAHALMRLGVSECASGERALQQLSSQHADLVIIDDALELMPGPETIRRILRFKPETKILALSANNSIDSIEAMTEAGALGYVLKTVDPAQLLHAIKHVLAGKKYYCNETALTMLSAADNLQSLAAFKISERERDILKMIVQGMTNSLIAERLFLSKRTIDAHRQNLLSKMKVHNTAALVKWAVDAGLLK